MAGVAVRTAVEVGLVYGLIHHSCHPDGQVGGQCEHETTPVWGGRSKASECLAHFGSLAKLREGWGATLGDGIEKQETVRPLCEQEAEFGCHPRKG